MKIKQLLFAILGLIVLVGCIWGTRELYYFYNPNVIISYRVQESEDLYLSLPSYAIEAESHFGYVARYDEEMQEWWLKTNEIEVKLRTDYVKPINISSNVYIEDGKTVITYMGKATLSNGESIDINEQVILDFVASDKLPEYN